MLLVAMGCFAAPVAAEVHAPGVAYRDCADCPDMVVVPAGVFVMGTPSAAANVGLPETPASERASWLAETTATVVHLPHAFAMGRREITRGEFARFITDSGYEPKAGCRTLDATSGRYRPDRTRTWLNPARPAIPEEAHPVSCVSHADAQAYAQWLARKTGKAYRLPSEAEWEYAARAGSPTVFPWGDDPAAGCRDANAYDLGAADTLKLNVSALACRDGFADVAPVGRFHANAYGLQDMLGNVAEWTLDCMTDSYVGRPADARPWIWVGGCAEHVVRGGGWNSPSGQLRSAARSAALADERNDALGFRVAVELDK